MSRRALLLYGLLIVLAALRIVDSETDWFDAIRNRFP